MKMRVQTVVTVCLAVGAEIFSAFRVKPGKFGQAATKVTKPTTKSVLTPEEVTRIGPTSKPVAASSLPLASTVLLPIFYTKDAKASPFAAASPSSVPKVVGQAAPTAAAEETKQTAATVLIEEKIMEKKVDYDIGVQPLKVVVNPIVLTSGMAFSGGRLPGVHTHAARGSVVGHARLDRAAMRAVEVSRQGATPFGGLLTKQVSNGADNQGGMKYISAQTKLDFAASALHSCLKAWPEEVLSYPQGLKVAGLLQWDLAGTEQWYPLEAKRRMLHAQELVRRAQTELAKTRVELFNAQTAQSQGNRAGWPMTHQEQVAKATENLAAAESQAADAALKANRAVLLKAVLKAVLKAADAALKAVLLAESRLGHAVRSFEEAKKVGWGFVKTLEQQIKKEEIVKQEAKDVQEAGNDNDTGKLQEAQTKLDRTKALLQLVETEAPLLEEAAKNVARADAEFRKVADGFLNGWKASAGFWDGVRSFLNLDLAEEFYLPLLLL